MMIWLFFIATAGALVFAAFKLTVYADKLADEYGVTKSFIGLVLVALVTSLPELTTSVSSVTKVDSPDMALGNVFGSVLFNLLILAISDAVFRSGGVLRMMDRRNIVSAIWDIIILGAMLLGLLFPVAVSLGALHVSLGSLLVIALGVMAFWAVHESERLHPLEAEEARLMEELKPQGNGVLMKFGFAALGVVVCGFALAVTGDKLATQTGLTHTFVGTLFLAIATSLPELIVSITAMRIGAYELMLGNILGSNIWNVMIIAFSDIAYARAPLSVPRNLGWGQVYSGLLGILATCVVILALVHRRPQTKRMPVARESMIIAAIYLVCLLGLFFGWSIL